MKLFNKLLGSPCALYHLMWVARDRVACRPARDSMRKDSMTRRVLKLIACALALAGVGNGCAVFKKKDPPALQPPSADVVTSHFIGSPLSGPVRGVTLPATAPAEPLYIADVQWISLKSFPENTLEPVDASARLTISPLSPGPLLPAGTLTLRARSGMGEAARHFRDSLSAGEFGEHVLIADQRGIVARGTTVRCDLAEPRGTTRPQRKLSLQIYRPAAQLPTTQQSLPTTAPGEVPARSMTIAIGIDDYFRAPSTDETDPVTPAPFVQQGRQRTSAPKLQPPTTRPPIFLSETAVLSDAALDSDASFAAVLPFAFADSPARGVAVLVTFRPVQDEPIDASLLHQFEDDLAAASLEPSTQSYGSVVELNTLQSAMRLFVSGESRRSALLFITQQTDAPLARDVALVGDDESIDAVATYLATLVPAAEPTLADVRWMLERSALLATATRLERPPPILELQSILSQHLGEVGRHPDLARELAQSATGPRDFENRLLAENIVFLEDSSPASRVRAFDWLSSKGQKIAGFNPLGSVRERRAALDKAFGGVTP